MKKLSVILPVLLFFSIGMLSFKSFNSQVQKTTSITKSSTDIFFTEVEEENQSSILDLSEIEFSGTTVIACAGPGKSYGQCLKLVVRYNFFATWCDCVFTGYISDHCYAYQVAIC